MGVVKELTNSTFAVVQQGNAVQLQGQKTDIPPLFDASLLFLIRLTPYIVAKMIKEVKCQKKAMSNPKANAYAPVYPNMVVDPKNCVDAVVGYIETLLGLPIAQLGSSSGGSSDEYLKCENLRWDFIGQVSTIYPLRPDVIIPLFDLLFKTLNETFNQPTTIAPFLQRYTLNCLVLISKNGRAALLQHLETLFAAVESVFEKLRVQDQQLLMQALVAAASADYAMQKRVVELVIQDKVNTWSTSPEIQALVKNENNALVQCFTPDRQCTDKSAYFAQAKKLGQSLQSFIAVLKQTVANSNNPYLIDTDSGDVGDNGSGGSTQVRTPDGTTDKNTPEFDDGFVTRRNPAADVVSKILPLVLELHMNLCRCFPSTFKNTINGGGPPPPLEDTEWIMIMGNQKAQYDVSQTVQAMFPGRDDFDKEAAIFIWQIRFATMRCLGACIGASDGFWQMDNVLGVMETIVRETFPLMSYHHIELFWKNCIQPIFTEGVLASSKTQVQTLSHRCGERICNHSFLRTLFDVTRAEMDSGWQRINSSTSSTPLLDPVITTSLLSLSRTIPLVLTKLLVCGFGGAHSNVFVDATTKIEARPLTWVDFLFEAPALHTGLRDFLSHLLKYPDPETQSRAVTGLKFYHTQIWTTGVVYSTLRRDRGAVVLEARMVLERASEL